MTNVQFLSIFKSYFEYLKEHFNPKTDLFAKFRFRHKQEIKQYVYFTPMAQLILSDIRIYPIKSLGGIHLDKASVQGKGLAFDRRWMVIDKDGVAMTQRLYPEMALFKLRLQQQELSIEYTKNEKVISAVSFNVSTVETGKSIHAIIWNDKVDVLEVNPAVSQWFTHHLKTTCTLVAFPEKNPRPVDPQYRVNNEQVSLADAYPFLLIGQSALDDLNQRLAHPVPMNRFRPNFVFTGGTPYFEDQWKNFSIGKLRFMAVKKSARCILTTVNQETGEKGSEPLHTLSTYRKVDNKIFFGQNLLALDAGDVAVGDPIIVA